MRILIVYYSQTGNTQKIARAIRSGLRENGDEVTLRFLKEASYRELENYDALGFGSPVWYEMPPNMRKFVEEMPDQKGKPGFSFCTHGTMPDLYFPLVVPRLARVGMKIVDWKDWYGNCSIQIFPEPYYTAGHPDKVDLSEAEEWGKDLSRKLDKVYRGDDREIPRCPAPDMMPAHANAAIDHLGGFHNVHGSLIRDPQKCLWPKCHICMDNCTMNYIDYTVNPQRFGSEGNSCDDRHGCTYCEMLCPTGAIKPMVPYEEAAPVGIDHGSELFCMVLEKAEREGKFRRLTPLSEVGTTTPYYSVHTGHPRIRQIDTKNDNYEE